MSASDRFLLDPGGRSTCHNLVFVRVPAAMREPLRLALGGGVGARNLEYRHCQTIQDSKHVYLKCQYVRNVGSLGALIKSNRIRFFARQPNRS